VAGLRFFVASRTDEMAKHDPTQQPRGPDPWTPIAREIDGRSFRGQWRIIDNQLQVTLQGYDSVERGDVDRSDPLALAGIMFSTLINHLLLQERRAAEEAAKKKAKKRD
jgi:hypothetical protein